MSSFFRRTVMLALVVVSFVGIPTLVRGQPFQPWDCTSSYWPFAGPVQWVSYPPVVYYEPCDVIPGAAAVPGRKTGAVAAAFCHAVPSAAVSDGTRVPHEAGPQDYRIPLVLRCSTGR